MEYTEVTISTTTRGSEIVSDILLRLGAAGTQILDRADLPDPNKPTANWELMDQSVIDAMPEDVQVKAWFDEDSLKAIIGSLREQLSLVKNSDMGTLNVTLQGVKEEDWAENWKQYYKGGTLLDVGTGSGILAIAAARLGADDVVAVDIDPDAVRVAKENVAHNGLEKAIDVRKGDLLQGLSQQFDFAVANILAPVICMLAAPLKKHLTPGGIFVCSGIIAEAEQDVNDALLKAGYTIDEVQHKGDWVAFACHVER